MDGSEGTPLKHCDHRPPKVGTIRTVRGVRVQCLSCGTIGPECKSAGEAFRALLKTPYRAGRSAISKDCATANLRMKGRLGAARARSTAGFLPLL